MQIGDYNAIRALSSHTNAFVFVRSASNVLALWNAIRQIGLKVGVFAHSGLNITDWGYAVEGNLLLSPLSHILRDVSNTGFVDFIYFTRQDGSICDIQYVGFPRDKLYPSDITSTFPEFCFNKYAIYYAEYEGGYTFTSQVPGEFRQRKSETVTQNYVREYFRSGAEPVSQMPSIDEVHPPAREINGQIRERTAWGIAYPALVLGQGSNTVTPHYRISAFQAGLDSIRPRTSALQYTFFVRDSTMHSNLKKFRLYDAKFAIFEPGYIAIAINNLLVEFNPPSLGSYVDVDLSNITPQAIEAPDGFQYFGLVLALEASPLTGYSGRVVAEIDLGTTTIPVVDQSPF